MQRVSVALRERLGDEASQDLEEFAEGVSNQGSKQMLEAATERFDNRLSSVAADLRLDMAGLRVEMQKGFAELRVELLRWSFFFWIGQVVAVASLLAFMLRSVVTK